MFDVPTEQVVNPHETEKFDKEAGEPKYEGPELAELVPDIDPAIYEVPHDFDPPAERQPRRKRPSRKPKAEPLKLREFPVERFLAKRKAFTVLFGRRESGKTWGLMWLLYWMSEFYARIVVISESERQNGTFAGIVPRPYIFTAYDNAIPEGLERSQTKLLNDADQQRLADMDPEHDPRVTVLVLDDCANNTNLRYGSSIMQAATRGRHFAENVLMTTQHPTLVGPTARDNANFVFLWWNVDRIQQKNFYDWYGGSSFESLDEFVETFRATTCPRPGEKGHCMVIDLNPTLALAEDRCFHMRFPKEAPPPYRFGSPQFWDEAAAVEENMPPEESADEGPDLNEVILERAEIAAAARRPMNVVF